MEGKGEHEKGQIRTTKYRPSLGTIWWTASRPHTLTASLCPCLVAFAANYDNLLRQNQFTTLVIWTVFCITIQIGTNLHNDYADYIQGADTDKRVGQSRATAQGWLTPTQTCLASCTVLTITLLAGVALANWTHQASDICLWLIVASSLFNAFAYTGGPFPLGYIGLGRWSIAYAGLGDLFVFLYFGLVATLTVPYLLMKQHPKIDLDWTGQLLYATQVGLLATNIIVVNNLRDRHTDVLAHKRTTAVRFGRTFSLIQYSLGATFTFLLVVINAIRQQYRGNLGLLPLLAVPSAVKEFRSIRTLEGGALNKHVGGAAKVQTAFCFLLALSLLLTSSSLSKK